MRRNFRKVLTVTGVALALAGGSALYAHAQSGSAQQPGSMQNMPGMQAGQGGMMNMMQQMSQMMETCNTMMKDMDQSRGSAKPDGTQQPKPKS